MKEIFINELIARAIIGYPAETLIENIPAGLWQYGMQKAAAVIAVINPDISVSPILYDIVKSAFYEGYLFHKGTRYHCDGAWEKSNTLKNILPLLAPAEISETTPYEDALALQQVKRNEKEGYLGVEGTKKFLADIIHQD